MSHRKQTRYDNHYSDDYHDQHHQNSRPRTGDSRYPRSHPNSRDQHRYDDTDRVPQGYRYRDDRDRSGYGDQRVHRDARDSRDAREHRDRRRSPPPSRRHSPPSRRHSPPRMGYGNRSRERSGYPPQHRSDRSDRSDRPTREYNDHYENNSQNDQEEYIGEATSGKSIMDYKYSTIPFREQKFNVNRERIIPLNCFSEMLPYFNDDDGPHFVIGKEDTQEIIQIPKPVYEGRMTVEGHEKMEYTEIVEIAIQKKNAVVKGLIHKTYTKGFERPSTIQGLAVMELIMGRDVAAQSKSGTGKTHTFLIGTLWHFDPENPNLQHIYVANTHEVAVQIYRQACHLLPENTKIALCIGSGKSNGSGFSRDRFRDSVGTSTLSLISGARKREIDANGSSLGSSSSDISNVMVSASTEAQIKEAQVIVCTMGKFYDLYCEQGKINTQDLRTFTVDEFDAIVASESNRRFPSGQNTQDQIRQIMRMIPASTQRVFFSATVNDESLGLACSYFRPDTQEIGDPFIVFLNSDDTTLDGIRQYYVACSCNEEKLDALYEILSGARIEQAIIFVNSVDMATRVKRFIDKAEVQIPNTIFHSKLSNEERRDIHHKFNSGTGIYRLLISTDVFSRGVDFQGINLVINFEMPLRMEVYIHRIGRSGRYGKKGVSISLITVNDQENDLDKIIEINAISISSKINELDFNTLDELL